MEWVCVAGLTLLKNNFCDHPVIFACVSDKSERSSIPEHQSHSFNETTTAASEAGIVFFLMNTFIKLKLLCFFIYLFAQISTAYEDTRHKYCGKER